MNGKFLLDTNIIISLFNDEPDIDEIIFNAEEVFVPCIAIGELYTTVPINHPEFRKIQIILPNLPPSIPFYHVMSTQLSGTAI